jgi:hypothetical protein
MLMTTLANAMGLPLTDFGSASTGKPGELTTSQSARRTAPRRSKPRPLRISGANRHFEDAVPLV